MKRILIKFCKILSLFNKIIKKKEMIVLYSNLGFRDNIEAFYNYLVQNKIYENYKIIVASNDYKHIKKNKNIKYVNCYFGVYYFLISKYFFYCFGKYPIVPSNDQIVVNLWHGMPLKKIGNLENGKEKNKYNYFTYLLSTSSFFDEIMMKSFNCEKENIIHVGEPRTDYFYKNELKSDLKNRYKKVIIWMPTFRTTKILKEINTSDSSNVLPLVHDINDLKLINDFLISENSILLIKLHPIQANEAIFSNMNNMSNIKLIDEKLLNNEEINLYELLTLTDILITDYSSVYFDYLLLNKPIIFTTEDLEDYKNRRGLNFENLEEIMPGEKVNTLNELINAIQKILCDRDNFKNDRETLNIKLNEFSVSNNCEKICEICGIEKVN